MADGGGVDVGAMSYRELQAMAKDFGRTDSGNHQLVPAKGKVDVLRANLASALAERSANTANAQQAPPAEQPKIIMFEGSPPKALAFSDTHRSARFWSSKPTFSGGSWVAKKPKTERRY